MIFLNPLMLAALAAASIPLLLHLLNRRRGRTIEIPTLRFLERMRASRLRSVRIERILLLILRIGIILFAVLGFAEPVLDSATSDAASPDDPVVILFDDSWSVRSGERGEEEWDRHVEIVAGLLGDLTESREHALLVMGAGIHPSDRELRRSRDQAVARLAQLRPSYASVRYRDGLRAAVEVLGAGGGEIILVSDLEANNFSGLSESSLTLPDNVRLRVVEPVDRAEGRANYSIDSIAIRTTYPVPGKQLEVDALVRRHGEPAEGDVTVALRIEGISGEALPVDRVRREQWIRVSKEITGSGPIRASLELKGDGIPEDNHYYFGLLIREQTRVLMDRGDGRSGSPETIVRLMPDVNLLEGTPDAGLSDVVAIVLVDTETGPNGAERIGEYVARGGGLLLFGGPNMANGANAHLTDLLGLSLDRSGTRGTDSLVVSQIDRTHPLFYGVFDRERPGRVDDLVVSRLLPATSGEQVLTLSSGGALLTTLDHGDGRVAYIAVPPDAAWSTLTRSALYVPLVVGSLRYVAARGSVEPTFRSGEAVAIRRSRLLRGVRAGGELTIVQPDGVRNRHVVSGEDRVALESLGRAGGVGHLEVMQNEKVIAYLGINGDPSESEGVETTPQQRLASFGRMVSDRDHLTFESDPVLSAGSRGLALWQISLILAFLCAVAESFVARRSALGQSASS